MARALLKAKSPVNCAACSTSLVTAAVFLLRFEVRVDSVIATSVASSWESDSSERQLTLEVKSSLGQENDQEVGENREK